MSDLNQCQFIGRLGANPQMRQTQSGEAMATFSIAVSEKWKDKQGQQQEKTEWVNITAFGKLAEIIGNYLQKGSQVFIQGKLATRKYVDNNGIERYATSIQASSLQMLGGSPQNQHQQNQPQWQQGYQQQPQHQQNQPAYQQGYQQQPQWQQKAAIPSFGSVADDNIPF